MSGSCKWCDTLTNSIVKLYESGRLVWVGCAACYEKKKKAEKESEGILNKHYEPSRLTDVDE
jgi:hypothetical protein